MANIFSIDGRQAVVLPDECRFTEDKISIRCEGNTVILEPIHVSDWPTDFFEAIRVDDPSFTRPAQGETPQAPTIASE